MGRRLPHDSVGPGGQILTTGLALVAFALCFIPAFERTHGMGVSAALVGIWTIIAPWVIHSSPTGVGTIASNAAIGTPFCSCSPS